MSNYIVLVKQVPDVSRITENAFDPETGNLMRNRLPSVINELDAEALGFVAQMRRAAGDESGQVVALTMGPPAAAEVLRYALARRVDRAVLLTDRVLGGADTFATANPLAHAVRRIAQEFFGGDEDYYIVSGMQSVDGDTAQVPAQMAEELGLPVVAYATGVAFQEGKFAFTRIITGGSQVVAVRQAPAVVTVAKYEYQTFATVAATRRGNRMELTQWTAADVGATVTGVKGSKTKVIRVFPPPATTRKRQQLTDIKQLAKVIMESYSGNGAVEVGASESGAARHYLLPEERESAFDRSYEGLDKDVEMFARLAKMLEGRGLKDVSEVTPEVRAELLEKSGFKDRELDELLAGLTCKDPAYRGDVWVMAELDGEAVDVATFELLGKARDLADSLGVGTGVLLAGESVERFTDELIAAGADKVYVVEHELLGEFEPRVYRKAVAEILGKYEPQIVLFGATPQGRVLAPMVSYRLECGLTADCTGLHIKDTSRKGEVAALHQTRPALGGNVMATICTKGSKMQMATARPGVMKRIESDASRRGEVVRCEVALDDSERGLDILRTERGGGKVNLGAEVIVSGGRGLRTKEGYERLIGELVTQMSTVLGAEVERGASRAAVEEGFVERSHQVGQTGTAVAPKVYVAMGISGAIQHMIGVAHSGTIIAINQDPNAPVFEHSDYYVVGDVEQIVPELLKELGAASDK